MVELMRESQQFKLTVVSGGDHVTCEREQACKRDLITQVTVKVVKKYIVVPEAILPLFTNVLSDRILGAHGLKGCIISGTKYSRIPKCYSTVDQQLSQHTLFHVAQDNRIKVV